MTLRDSLEIVSALLGMLGGLLVAIPFFDDFMARRKREKSMKVIGKTEIVGRNVDQVLLEVEKGEFNVLLYPDPKMAFISGVGCVFLIFSFVVLLASKLA